MLTASAPWELFIRLAGAGLVLVVLANCVAPLMLSYGANLDRCDRIFAQIFIVHAAYIVLVTAAMAALCLWRPGFFLETVEGRVLAGFMGFYWGSRFLVQVIYYDRATKRDRPGWNLLFTLAFAALGGGFTTIALLP